MKEIIKKLFKMEDNEITPCTKDELQKTSSCNNEIAKKTPIVIITKCAYDKGKAHICIESLGDEGVMMQLTLSPEDVFDIVKNKQKTRSGYQLPEGAR